MKNNIKKTNIKPYMRELYRGNLVYLALATLGTLVGVTMSLLIAWLLQVLIDMLGGSDVGYTLLELAVFVLLCVMLSILSGGLRYISKPRLISDASRQYKNYVFARLTEKGVAAFSTENTAAYLSALSNDVNSIETGYLSSIFVILYNVLVFIGALIMMLWYSPILTLISVAVAIFPFIISILAGGFLSKAEKNVSDKNEAYIAALSGCLSGFCVIKSFRAERQIHALLGDKSEKLAKAKERRHKTAITVEVLGDISRFVLQFGVLFAGTVLAFRNGGISAGTVMVFVQLLNYVINPIEQIPQALAECKASKALIEKLAASLEANVRDDGEVDKRELDLGITVRSLSFAYEADKNVLNDVSFNFEAGKSYCLVGASGSGKSTLLNLLMASHSDYSGEIRYDDAELRDIRSESLYSMVSVIQQNVFIFNASIRDNITMFADFPRDAVDKAIEMSGLSELTAERGENYLCGENGSGLSGGEKQRISIARSLLKRSQVLLVDEATASLDAQTAAQVANAILGLDGITRIVVTHALDEALLKQYDCILTLKKGQLVEAGDFEELMRAKGYFYSLYTVTQ